MPGTSFFTLSLSLSSAKGSLRVHWSGCERKCQLVVETEDSKAWLELRESCLIFRFSGQIEKSKKKPVNFKSKLRSWGFFSVLLNEIKNLKTFPSGRMKHFKNVISDHRFGQFQNSCFQFFSVEATCRIWPKFTNSFSAERNAFSGEFTISQNKKSPGLSPDSWAPFLALALPLSWSVALGSLSAFSVKWIYFPHRSA